MSIEIESGIEISLHKNTKYPWKELDVGQSFFVPGGKLRTFYGMIAYHETRSDRRFRAQAAISDFVKGERVWRIE